MVKIVLNAQERADFLANAATQKLAETYIAPKSLETLYTSALDGNAIYALESIEAPTDVPQRLKNTGQEADFIRMTPPHSIVAYSDKAEAFSDFVKTAS